MDMNCFFCGEWLGNDSEVIFVKWNGRTVRVSEECAALGEEVAIRNYQEWCEFNGVEK